MANGPLTVPQNSGQPANGFLPGQNTKEKPRSLGGKIVNAAGDVLTEVGQQLGIVANKNESQYDTYRVNAPEVQNVQYGGGATNVADEYSRLSNQAQGAFQAGNAAQGRTAPEFNSRNVSGALSAAGSQQASTAGQRQMGEQAREAGIELAQQAQQQDYSRAMGAYGAGQAQLGVLQQAQAGGAPSVAQTQLQGGVEDAARAQLAASLSGGFNPAAQAAAAQQAGQLQASANQDAAALRAQEIAQARGETTALIGAQQGAAGALAGMTAEQQQIALGQQAADAERQGLSLEQEQNILRGGELGLALSQAQSGNELGQRQLNDLATGQYNQTGVQMTDLSQNPLQSQMGADLEVEKLRQSGFLGGEQINADLYTDVMQQNAAIKEANTARQHELDKVGLRGKLQKNIPIIGNWL